MNPVTVHWADAPSGHCYRCGKEKPVSVLTDYVGWWSDYGVFNRPNLAPTDTTEFGLCDMADTVAAVWRAQSEEVRQRGRKQRPRRKTTPTPSTAGAS